MSRVRTPLDFANAEDFRISLEATINRKVNQEGKDHERLRRAAAFERMLARTFASQQDTWLLKGGVAMELRHVDARMTKDLDLTRTEKSSASIGEELRQRLDIDLGDHFTFRVSEPRRDLIGPIGGGQRFAVEARIANRLFVRFPIDLSLGEGAVLPPEIRTVPSLFGAYDLPPVEYRMICAEQQFAEKLHAMTLTRDGKPSSRTKDLVDMYLLIQGDQLEPEKLHLAIQRIFDLRTSHSIPNQLPRPPEFWRERYRVLAQDCHIEDDIDLAYSLVQGYLDQILSKIPSEA